MRVGLFSTGRVEEAYLDTGSFIRAVVLTIQILYGADLGSIRLTDIWQTTDDMLFVYVYCLLLNVK